MEPSSVASPPPLWGCGRQTLHCVQWQTLAPWNHGGKGDSGLSGKLGMRVVVLLEGGLTEAMEVRLPSKGVSDASHAGNLTDALPHHKQPTPPDPTPYPP